MDAMTPDGLSDLLACVAAFGRSLDESFDPTRFLAEFSARTQRPVPHDYMLIALREGDGKTRSVFAEYAVRGAILSDGSHYTTASGRVPTDVFALAPVFEGDEQLIADMATDERLGDATAFRAKVGEASPEKDQQERSGDD